METGAVRVAENNLNSGGTVARWREMLGAVAWTIGLFHSIQQEAGPTVGANVAIHVGGIWQNIPDSNFGTAEQQRIRLRNRDMGNRTPPRDTVLRAHLAASRSPAT